MFQSTIIAGFECGFLESSGQDFLASSGHVPSLRQADNYELLRKIGVTTTREGLVPWHDLAARMAVAKHYRMQVIYDLVHYWDIGNPEAYAKSIVAAYERAGMKTPLWVCPVNEPTVHPMFRPESFDDIIRTGRAIVDILHRAGVPLRIVSVDPVHHGAELDWKGHDAFEDMSDVIGINLYPHDLREDHSISEILLAAHERYKRPVAITETSLHDGHHGLGYRNAFDKVTWFQHVIAEARFAKHKGADVVGLCWYPIIDTVPWLGSGDRWPHGLMKADGTFDEALARSFQFNGGI